MSLTKWRKEFKGIRFRITFVYSSLFGIFICAFAYFMSNQYFQSGREDFDSGLLNYAIDLSEYLQVDQASHEINFKLPRSEDKKAFPFILNQTFYMVRSFSGKVIAKSKNLPFKDMPYDPKLPPGSDYTHRFITFSHEKEVYRAVNLKISDVSKNEMILQIATPYGTLLERERNHLLVTAFILPFLILGSSFLSYLVAGRALSPIKNLTDSANNIAIQNLSLRVPVLNTGDEVEDLAKTINNLLTRLETSFKAQENFVSNASHQLNTPLAIIKGELDVLESKGRSLEEYRLFQKSLREELERLIELVKNMLLVSRVESGQEKFVFNPIRLDDLLLGTTSRFQTKAREKKITIRFDIDENMNLDNLEVLGERQLLDSLFENILDNAIKYSPVGSIIELSLKCINGHKEVWIKDEGPGFEEEKFQTILTDRYHREPSISIQGTGIGLPIANKIAEFHQAKIMYKRLEPHGSLFMVRFS